MDYIDELERLGALRERGILSDVEFQAQKSRLLSAQATNVDTPPPLPLEADYGFSIFEMFTSPNRCVRLVLDRHPLRHYWSLMVMHGVVFAFNVQISRLSQSSPELQRSVLLEGLFVSLLAGPIAGFLLIGLTAALISLCGRWLGGEGSAKQIRTALAWAWFPTSLIALSSQILVILEPSLIPYFQLLSLLLCPYHMFLTSHSIAAAERFSAWKGFVSAVFLPFALIVGPIVAIAVFVFLSAGR